MLSLHFRYNEIAPRLSRVMRFVHVIHITPKHENPSFPRGFVEIQGKVLRWSHRTPSADCCQILIVHRTDVSTCPHTNSHANRLSPKNVASDYGMTVSVN